MHEFWQFALGFVIGGGLVFVLAIIVSFVGAAIAVGRGLNW